MDMAEAPPLQVTAVVVESRRAPRDPAADLQVQLEEAKAAAMAAADRMQSLLQQMAVMETEAAERRLAELNARAELNKQQLPTTAAAATSVTPPTKNGKSVALPADSPDLSELDALKPEPRPDAKEAHQDDRHHGITMTDIFDDPDHNDDQAPIDTKLPFLLHDASKPPMSRSLSGGAATGPEGKAEEASQEGKLGTLMGVFVPCLQNILGTIYFLRSLASGCFSVAAAAALVWRLWLR